MSLGFGLGKSIIKEFDSHPLDLHHRVTFDNGIIYRCDHPSTQTYDYRFWRRLNLWESSAEFFVLLRRRLEVTDKIAGGILEVGVGAGGFFRENVNRLIWGYDVLDESVSRVIRGRYCAPHDWHKISWQLGAVCCFDTLDLLTEPDAVFSAVPPGAVFVGSLPIFEDLKSLKKTDIFQPMLRNVYFSRQGFQGYLEKLGFCVEILEDESSIDSKRQYSKMVVCRKASTKKMNPSQ